MKKWILIYINDIDAALGSGDPSEEELAALEKAIPHWLKAIQQHREIHKEIKQIDDIQ